MLPFQKSVRTSTPDGKGRKRLRDGEPTPIGTLLDKLKGIRSLFVDLQQINGQLAPYVQEALANDDSEGSLLQLFEKFSWCRDQSVFLANPDLYCLSSALSKHRYVKVKALGSGSYAVVYKARNRETDEFIALKKFRFGLDSHGIPSSTLREITLLRDLKHPNIVEIKDVIWSFGSPSVYVVLECLDCDLREHIDTCVGASDMTNVKAFVYQILKALAFAHSNRVMHRDLKPQNILVDRANQRLKIADFGLARAYLPPYRPYTEKVVTLWYRAPELLLGAPHYTTAVDIWSIGCIFAEMLNNEPLFKSESEVGLLHRIFHFFGTPSPQQWADLDLHAHYRANFPQWRPQPLAAIFPRLANDPLGLDLIASMLQLDPNKRVSAAAALEHPWLQDVRTAEAALHSQCWQPGSPSAFAANLATALQTAQFQSPGSDVSSGTPPLRQAQPPPAQPHPPRPSRLSRSSSTAAAQQQAAAVAPLPPPAGPAAPSRFGPAAAAQPTTSQTMLPSAHHPQQQQQQQQQQTEQQLEQQLLCTSPSRPAKPSYPQGPVGPSSNESEQEQQLLGMGVGLPQQEQQQLQQRPLGTYPAAVAAIAARPSGQQLKAADAACYVVPRHSGSKPPQPPQLPSARPCAARPAVMPGSHAAGPLRPGSSTYLPRRDA